MKIPRKTQLHIARVISSLSLFVFLNGVFDLLRAYGEISKYREQADPMIRNYLEGREYKPFNSSMDESFFVHRNFTAPSTETDERNFSLEIMSSLFIASASLFWLMMLNKPKPPEPGKPSFPWDGTEPAKVHPPINLPQ